MNEMVSLMIDSQSIRDSTSMICLRAWVRLYMLIRVSTKDNLRKAKSMEKDSNHIPMEIIMMASLKTTTLMEKVSSMVLTNSSMMGISTRDSDMERARLRIRISPLMLETSDIT